MTEEDVLLMRGQIRVLKLRVSSMERENNSLKKALWKKEAECTALLRELQQHGWDYPGVEVDPEEKEQDDGPGPVESDQP